MTSLAEDVPRGASAFRIERDGDLAILWFDLPGEKVNKFSTVVMTEFAGVVDELEQASEIKRIIVASGKPSIFIAGADVNEFSKATSAAQAVEYTRFGQQTIHRFSKLPQVTVAAINGAALGGGCELALACDYRVMSDSPKAQIGLPETKLGIFPAWGGVTRLPRLIGLPAALDIILNGKTLDGRRAKKMGLVDEVVPAAILLDVAKQFSGRGKRRGGNRTKFYVEGNPLARRIIFGKARKAVLAQTHGHYPAPLKAIEVMDYGMSAGIERGLAREVDEVVPLIVGSTGESGSDVAQNLIRLFFMMEDSKKERVAAAPLEVRDAGVLGAGIMGGGIAQVVADKTDASVRMRDINWKAIAGGMKAAARIWKKKVDRRRMTRGEMQRSLARITSTIDWAGFERCDLVVEAVVENVDVKRQVLREFETIAKPGAIFATNTSTIPITDIAAQAAHPENVAGMHFFNPVDRMPLVEVIRGAKTSDLAMATVANFARKLGKTVVYCNDGPGFVVNRILGPYMNEAGFLLEEGNTIESIDKAMVDFGMPMGPMALLDEVGIDVAAKVAKILGGAFGERMEPSQVVDTLYADGRYGKKNGKGLYLYEAGKRQGPDGSVYKVLGIRGTHPADAPAVVERMIFAMVNEAAMILDEKIVASPGELDLAMIMGTGFPPFRGGLLRYADKLGLPYILARLDDLAQKHGKRFLATAALRKLAERDGKFYR
ncbi:MAG: 3-hydroxyacyl-CoA dehydrogenase / enoyl-CoA hydratase / 3-hydroxybutyryl-CoA epimerase [Thermoanaerobaculia bacterium]|jgi:3-hydroxyacyl-CoA dehydrogenase/enoyl-CoA hydratase/3-hydroxybutyryl-CoA epimerase|nr:3-hydroxyacyl-CoA dehydrogenase / enoyl-CoA hydratase / 3-hydroxybutyryl-CoA epimerase [Thermoanaerobaculia bacterium]